MTDNYYIFCIFSSCSSAVGSSLSSMSSMLQLSSSTSPTEGTVMYADDDWWQWSLPEPIYSTIDVSLYSWTHQNRNHFFSHLALVVRGSDNAIHWINLYTLNISVCFVTSYLLEAIYPLDSIIHPLNIWALSLGNLTQRKVLKATIINLTLLIKRKCSHLVGRGGD